MQKLHGRLLVGITAIFMLAITGVAVAAGLSDSGSRTRPVSTHGPHTNRPARCPGRDRRMLSSTTTGANAALVPAGAQQVLLCRYTGLGGYPKPVGPGSFRLIAHHLVVKLATVESIAGELNALEKQTGYHSYACPSDNGRALIAFFRYGSNPERAVSV